MANKNKMLSQIKNKMETCHFDEVPNVIGIIDSTMSGEHKRVLVAKVHNYEEGKTSRELDGEVKKDNVMNGLKVSIYAFAVHAKCSDHNAKRLAAMPFNLNLMPHLAEFLVLERRQNSQISFALQNEQIVVPIVFHVLHY